MMKAEYINPFLNASMNVIQTMAMMSVTPEKPGLKQGNQTWGVVSGVIGLTSAKYKGNFVLSFDEPSILSIVNNMLGESFSEINRDVTDAVGELTNMITGGAKKEFSESGISFEMALPIMIMGRNVEIVQLGEGPTITIPFQVPAGRFVAEVSLREGASS